MSRLSNHQLCYYSNTHQMSIHQFVEGILTSFAERLPATHNELVSLREICSGTHSNEAEVHIVVAENHLKVFRDFMVVGIYDVLFVNERNRLRRSSAD
jgi:hypothetical protein